MNRFLISCVITISAVVAFISCSKEVSFEANNGLAKGSLHDVSGNCFTPVIRGTYARGIATGDSNYVTVQVNVTTAGKYTIATDTLNGFSFSNTGNFNTTGIQTINLKASGMPILGQATTFTIIFDTTICSFSVNVNDSSQLPDVNDSDTAWTFTESGRKYNGYIESIFTKDTVAFNQNFKIVQLQGATAASGDSVFLLSITFPGGNISTGTFSTNSTTLFRFLGSYNISDTIYSASPLTPTVTTIVNVTSYDPASSVLRGTFSGTAKNRAGNTVTISSGRVQAKLR